MRLLINSVPYELPLLTGFRVDQKLGLKPIKSMQGKYKVRDRGVASDSYASTLNLLGTSAQMNTLSAAMRSTGSFVVEIDQVTEGQRIFGQNITFSQTYRVGIMSLSPRKKQAIDIYTQDLSLELYKPSSIIGLFTSTTASLDDLRFEDITYTGDILQLDKNRATYDRTILSDTWIKEDGVFSSSFIQTEEETDAILNFFRTTRGSAYPFPISTIKMGGDYPFNDGNATPNVITLEYNVTKYRQKMFRFSIKWGLAA